MLELVWRCERLLYRCSRAVDEGSMSVAIDRHSGHRISQRPERFTDGVNWS